MKVLVVDDDKLARKGLIAVMEWEKYGFRVEGDVQNGRKALEFLDSHDVDIVFTDIDMPEMDGLTLMQECKKRYPNVQFVIFSMYEDFRYAQTAIRMGALDYISKISFDVEECGQILQGVQKKYLETKRKAGAVSQKNDSLSEGDEKIFHDLENEWMSSVWLFDDDSLAELSEKTRQLSLRSAERIFIKSLYRFHQMLGRQREQFPVLNDVDEMLRWIDQWRQQLYEECEDMKNKDDIHTFAYVIKYVKANVSENIKSEDVADRIGMSRSYFSTRFREMTGETFHSFLIGQKLREAKRRIEEGTDSITMIASDLGYDHFHYFTKMFLKQYGCTPSEYRESKKCSK